MPNLIIWLLVLYVIYQFFLIIIDIRRLKRMHDFYLHLLNIPDSDMQTISWQEVVARIMSLRDANPITADIVAPRLRHFMGSQSKQRLDAVDIANRLMRRENYLIAMFNKEILDLTLPIPFFKNRQIFSKTIEWNIHFTIMDFIFSQEGQIQELVLKDAKRRQLSDALKSRFFFAGLMNIICAPGIVIYLLISYFFRYFQVSFVYYKFKTLVINHLLQEYQKNPSAVNARAYTPLAEWKFREFNELYHLFHRRMDMSYPFAQRYVDQFPRIKSVSVASFIAFVAGGLVSVLALASIIDPELFLGFEITPDRTVLFYLGVLGTIWAACHGAVPPDHVVFDPEYALRNVIDYTHYSPVQWKDRLHSNEVKQEFSELYKMKIVIFIEEILSIIFLPFILWFSLPKCSDRIIDFFREFTVHVDGLGYVCSFAVFDFKKGVGSMAPNGASNAADGLKDEYYSTKHGKMAASYYGFLDNYATNPKTGIPGHIPPGMRHPFYPPPAFPGLMSHSLGGDMQLSRNGRTERPKPRSSAAAAAGIIPTRTPRFPPTAGLTSPMPSMLLDPHHQPSTSGFGGGGGGGGRSVHATGNRSRYQASRHIIEDFPVEDEEEDEVPGRGRIQRQISLPSEESGLSGLDGSRWETSPTRKDQSQAGMEEDEVGGGGVLGLLYQFQKAQTDGRAGVNI
jgi:autophagy-related protein 9